MQITGSDPRSPRGRRTGVGRRRSSRVMVAGAAGALALATPLTPAGAGSVRIVTSGPTSTFIVGSAGRENRGNGIVRWSAVRAAESNSIFWPWFVCDTAGWAANVDHAGNLFFVTEKPVSSGCAYVRTESFDNLNGDTTSGWGVRFKWKSQKTGGNWNTIGEVWS